MRLLPTSLLALSASLTFAACSGGGVAPMDTPLPPPPVPVASISLAPAEARLLLGANTQATAIPRDAAGNALTRTVTWRAENAAIATVTTTGVVTGIAVGTTRIIAMSENTSGTIAVTVVPVPVASIAVGGVGSELVPGEPRTLSAAVKDSAGSILTDRTVTWRSSQDALVTVSPSGIVTARAVGVATIVATAEGRTDSVRVPVAEGGFITPLGGTARTTNGAFELVARASTVAIGTALRVSPTPTAPTHPRLIPGTAFTLAPDGLLFAQAATLSIGYTVSNGAVLPRQFRVHRWNGTSWTLLAGVVDTVGRRVSADVQGGGLYALLEVPRPVASVSVSPVTVSMLRESARQLTATVRAADGDALTDRAIAWRSSDPSIATVSNAGIVTALAAGGPVTITATSEGRDGAATVSVTAPVPTFASVFTGRFTTCGLRSDGEAWCWGANDSCELGITPCSGGQLTAIRVATALRFTELSLGDGFTCGLTSARDAWCWGNNLWGNLGIGVSGNRSAPTAVVGGHLFSSIRANGVRANGVHACGLRSSGETLCWGSNGSGQVGDSDDPRGSSSPVRTRGGHQFIQIAVGGEHSCGLTAAGQAFCWGENVDGALGDGTTSNRFSPVMVGGNHLFVQLSVGDFHSCGRTSVGALWCWGWNDEGQLGDGSRITRTSPVRVIGGDVFAGVFAFGWTTCGLLQSGEAKCWGENEEGELGIGSRTDRLAPTSVNGGLRFATLTSGGGYHVCGRTLDSVWYCWGFNRDGQLGLGVLGDVLTPTQLPIPGFSTSVATSRAAASFAPVNMPRQKERPRR